MKRIGIVLAAVVLAALFTGCSVIIGTLRRVAPHHTPQVVVVTMAPDTSEDTVETLQPSEEATQAPTVEPTQAPTVEPTQAAPRLNIYSSSALGIAFAVPDSWVGKYRVEEGDGYLTVYFKPKESIDPNVGDGELFCIVKKTPDIDTSMYDNPQEFEINGAKYIWGQPTDVRYSQGQPEYDTYVKMQQDFASIYQSIQAAD